ncbi:ABC transporter gloK [Fusarium oxysporum f. sp. albedinis]|nr:ABC transporter gloK [Fusarium oxysporum f. sp. albedinis]
MKSKRGKESRDIRSGYHLSNSPLIHQVQSVESASEARVSSDSHQLVHWPKTRGTENHRRAIMLPFTEERVTCSAVVPANSFKRNITSKDKDMPTIKRIQIRFNCKKRLPSLIYLNELGKLIIKYKSNLIALL